MSNLVRNRTSQFKAWMLWSRGVLLVVMVSSILAPGMEMEVVGSSGTTALKLDDRNQSHRRRTNYMTANLHQLPFNRIATEELTDEYGLYPKDWLISPIQPVVVRQDGPKSARYQEAIGYTFLLFSAKFPSVVRMDGGRLVLNVSYEDTKGQRQWITLPSDDDGRSWGRPRPSPVGRSTLISLGGKKLMAFNSKELLVSEDAGETWSAPESVPPLPDGRTFNTDVPYTHLVEDRTITFMGYVEEQPAIAHWEDSKDIWTRAVMRRYHLDTRTWDEPYLFTREWGLCEGSVTRARNGDLVAAFRTQMQDGTRITNDHWMGLATSRSTDNGRTWDKPAHAFRYGHHHINLLRLADGRIFMTYAARVGELEGMPYHGIEAVISNNNGATWDWAHRFILFRWMNSQTMHSPGSVSLSDGRILTIFQHDASYSHTDERYPKSTKGMMQGNVSVVIWRP